MRFRTILADPPWLYETYSIKGRDKSPDRHYACMSIDALRSLPVSGVADKSACLLLWATWPKMTDAMSLIEAWGFTYRTGFPWVKMHRAAAPRRGTGYHIAACSEPLLIATRGTGVCPPQGGDNIGVMFHPQGAHSAKPDDQYDFAERYPAPYLEMFARPEEGGLFPPRPGWTFIGSGATGRDIGDDLRLLSEVSK